MMKMKLKKLLLRKIKLNREKQKMTNEIKIKWRKDSQVGSCEISDTITQWIAITEYGWIRCAKYNIRCSDSNVWNRILSNKIEDINKEKNKLFNRK